MKNYKIIKHTNGIGKNFYCIKKRKNLIFWRYLKFTKNVHLTPRGELTEEAYMFDSIERAQNLVKNHKNLIGNININGETVEKL